MLSYASDSQMLLQLQLSPLGESDKSLQTHLCFKVQG